MSSVCGNGALGHDHLMDLPGGADFNVAWEPILVLFTSKAAANEHLLTETQIDAAVDRGDGCVDQDAASGRDDTAGPVS